MTDLQAGYLSETLTMARHNRKMLNHWEQSFVNDLTDRFVTWGHDLHVTDKMWTILGEIRDKCESAD